MFLESTSQSKIKRSIIVPTETQTKNSDQVLSLLQGFVSGSCLDEEAFGRALERDPELISLRSPIVSALQRLSSNTQPVDSRLLESLDVFCLDGVDSSDSETFFRNNNPDVDFYYIDSSVVKLAEKVGIETNVPAADIRLSRFRDNTRFQPVLDELGKEDDVKVALAHLIQMLTDQGKGQNGRLLTNGRANITPLGGGLCFRYYWDGGNVGWYCNVFLVSNDRVWLSGSQVLSC